jgi:hypothetical protein
MFSVIVSTDLFGLILYQQCYRKKVLLVLNGKTYISHLAKFALQVHKGMDAVLEAVFISPFVQQTSQYPFPWRIAWSSRRYFRNKRGAGGTSKAYSDQHRIIYGELRKEKTQIPEA